MDPFWLKLALSFLIGGAYIAFTIFLSEKFGSKLGGIILGLPSTTLASLIFIYWTQDASAVLSALPATPAALSIASLFVSAFIIAYRYGRKIAFLAAFLLWIILSLLIIALKLDLISSTMLAGVNFSIAILFLSRFPHRKLDKNSDQKHEFIYRSAFAGVVISLAVFLAKTLGPVWGGVFGVFPAAFTSSLYLLSSKHGFEFTSSVARTMPLGAIGSAVFVIALYMLIPVTGFWEAVVISYILSVIYAVIIYYSVLKENGSLK